MANRQSSPLHWLFETWIEPRLPGAIRALPFLSIPVNLLSGLSPFHVRDAALLWSRLQRICGRPYVPAFERDWIVPANHILPQEGELRSQFDEVQRYLLCATLIYGNVPGLLAKVKRGRPTTFDGAMQFYLPCVEVLHKQEDTQGLVPSHFVGLDHTHKKIIVSVRGSCEPADWVINLVCGTSTHGTHVGMHEAAISLQAKLVPVLTALAKEHPKYDIILTGHSMGAGVCALMALDFASKNFYNDRVKAICFATPLVLHADLLDDCKASIHNFVVGRDLVCHGGFIGTTVFTRILFELVKLLQETQPSFIDKLDATVLGSDIGDDETVVITPTTSAAEDFESPFSLMSDTSHTPRTPEELSVSYLLSQKSLPVHVDFPVPITELCSLVEQRMRELEPCTHQSSFLSAFNLPFMPEEKAEKKVVLDDEFFSDCLKVLETQWTHLFQRLSTLALCIPGDIIHIIPKSHLEQYRYPKIKELEPLFIHNCLFLRLPPSRTKQFCSECALTLSSIADHLVGAYFAAFVPDLLNTK